MDEDGADGRPIWSANEPRSPTRRVAGELGLEPADVSAALHKIKRAAGLTPKDRVNIMSSGDVYDRNGDWIGNIRDEI